MGETSRRAADPDECSGRVLREVSPEAGVPFGATGTVLIWTGCQALRGVSAGCAAPLRAGRDTQGSCRGFSHFVDGPEPAGLSQDTPGMWQLDPEGRCHVRLRFVLDTALARGAFLVAHLLQTAGGPEPVTATLGDQLFSAQRTGGGLEAGSLPEAPQSCT